MAPGLAFPVHTLPACQELGSPRTLLFCTPDQHQPRPSWSSRRSLHSTPPPPATSMHFLETSNVDLKSGGCLEWMNMQENDKESRGLVSGRSYSVLTLS